MIRPFQFHGKRTGRTFALFRSNSVASVACVAPRSPPLCSLRLPARRPLLVQSIVVQIRRGLLERRHLLLRSTLLSAPMLPLPLLTRRGGQYGFASSFLPHGSFLSINKRGKLQFGPARCPQLRPQLSYRLLMIVKSISTANIKISHIDFCTDDGFAIADCCSDILSAKNRGHSQ